MKAKFESGKRTSASLVERQKQINKNKTREQQGHCFKQILIHILETLNI